MLEQAERAAILERLHILDTPDELPFDDLVDLAASLCDAPLAFFGLIDADRQWFKARHGFEFHEAPMTLSFCSRTISAPSAVVVPDLAEDPEFSTFPQVNGANALRFYAGVSIRLADGPAIGTLCVLDVEPRQLTPRQVAGLTSLGRQVQNLLELRMAHFDAQAVHQKLALSEQRFRRVIASLVQGVVVQQHDGTISEANPAASQILGLTLEQLQGRHPIDPRWGATHLDGSPFPGDEHPASVTLREGVEVTDVVMGVKRPDDSQRWIVVNSAPLFDPETGLPGALATFVDVTELLELALQLQASLDGLTNASRENAAMVSAVSHDLRTPIASIRIMAQLLDDHGDEMPTAKRTDLVRRIRNEAYRTEGALSDLVSVDRIGSGLAHPSREHVDICELARTGLRQIAASSRSTSVVCEPDEVMIWASRAQIERIIDNLISNSVRHCPQGSSVIVEVRQIGDTAVISVEDDGPGVEKSLQPKLFDAYSRGVDSAARPGSGIGLFLVQSFAAFHGGEARYADRPAGGSRFVVTLPIDRRRTSRP